MTIKPSQELFFQSVEPVKLMKSHRVEIASEIHRVTGKRIHIRGYDKTKQLPLTIDPRVHTHANFKDMSNGGMDAVIYEEYVGELDREDVIKFFTRLEDAATGFLVDLQREELKPTPGQIKVKLKQIAKTSERLEKHITNADDASINILIEQGVDIDLLTKSLDLLITACDSGLEQELSIELKARFNLCLAVLFAINGLGLKVSTSREGLADYITKYLAKRATGGKIIDINDSLTAANVEFRRQIK
jgi:hypothetical protein